MAAQARNRPCGWAGCLLLVVIGVLLGLAARAAAAAPAPRDEADDTLSANRLDERAALAGDGAADEVIGGDALGGDALDGGDALGSDALGSDALEGDALGGDALGGDVLGGDALGGDVRDSGGLESDGLKSDALESDALEGDLHSDGLDAVATERGALDDDELRTSRARDARERFDVSRRPASAPRWGRLSLQLVWQRRLSGEAADLSRRDQLWLLAVWSR